MNNGDDTAYYLRRGFAVVAIEANPALCDAARIRFAEHLGDGRLLVENVGIADREGEMTFWVSEHSVWSSFRQSSATKGGTKASPITVRTVPFADLLERHGVPHFVKVDIEGHDRLCLEDLAPARHPKYVSVEMSHPTGDVDIELLASAGYERFKCVRQNDFFEILPGNLDRQIRRRQRLSRLGPLEGRIRRLARRSTSVDGWRFPFGSSGPCPWELPGQWMTRAEVLSVWERLRDTDVELNDKGLGEWFDIHACDLAPGTA